MALILRGYGAVVLEGDGDDAMSTFMGQEQAAALRSGFKEAEDMGGYGADGGPAKNSSANRQARGAEAGLEAAAAAVVCNSRHGGALLKV